MPKTDLEKYWGFDIQPWEGQYLGTIESGIIFSGLDYATESKLAEPEWYSAAPPNLEEIVKDFGIAVDTELSEPDKEMAESYEFVPPKPSAPWVTFVDEAFQFPNPSWELPSYGFGGFSKGGIVGPSEPRQPLPHQCHCFRDRHEQPLTQKVSDMLSQHRFDPNYRAQEDDSPIICVGSETYGPNRGAPASSVSVSSGGYTMADLNAMKGSMWTFSTGPGWEALMKSAGLSVTYTNTVEKMEMSKEQK